MVPDLRIFVLAGGLGTRLAHIAPGVPKPMAPVAGRPFLEWQIEGFSAQGFREFVFLVGHKKEAIVEHFGNGRRFGIHIEYSVEEELMGTGGAFLQALEAFPCEQFVLVNGDTYFNVPLEPLLSRSRGNRTALWLGSKLVSQPYRYGTLDFDDDGVVRVFREKDPSVAEGFINGGVYVGYSDSFSEAPVRRSSLEQDLLPTIVEEGRLRFLVHGDPFIDIGIPEDFARAQTVIPRWHKREKRKALFLDRDGVLIRDPGYVSRVEDVELIPEGEPFFRKAKGLGYLLIVVSNQAGVAKGKLTLEQAQAVNDAMVSQWAERGVHFDEVRICPFHPDGVIPEFTRPSFDRKPYPGMILAAAETWGISLEDSVMVGDKDTDIIAFTSLPSFLVQGVYALEAKDRIRTFDELVQWLETQG